MCVKAASFSILITVLICLSACGAKQTTTAVTSEEGDSSLLALVGGNLIDGSGSSVMTNSVILIRDGLIEKVGSLSDTTIPASYLHISTAGMTVMPGLWDMHVHLLYAGHTNNPYWHETYTQRFDEEIMPATAAQHLQSGVTTVRDLGAPAAAIFNLRDRITAGTFTGPTVFAAGPQINRNFPDWARFYRTPVANPEEAAAAANELIEAGADVLKITKAENMSVADIRAITDAAHARGVKVTAHGRTDREILMGLQGGVDEFQHIGASTDSPEYPAEIMDAIRARVAAGPPLYWTPTVGLQLRASNLEANLETFDAEENFAGLPEDIVSDIKQSLDNYAPELVDPAIVIRKVTQLRNAGVELLVGTDAGLAGNFHSLAMWQEMESWVNVLGIDALETIQRATSIPASYMGNDGKAGKITAGQVADIAVFSGDPLANMAVLNNPVVVLKEGRRIR